MCVFVCVCVFVFECVCVRESGFVCECARVSERNIRESAGNGFRQGTLTIDRLSAYVQHAA